MRQFELAKALYRRLLKLELRHNISKSLSLEELHECKVRECDLLDVINRDKGVSGDSYEILNCWKEGIALFPHSGLMFNELGSNYLQRGMHEAAYHAFSNAVKLGIQYCYVFSMFLLCFISLQQFSLTTCADFTNSFRLLFRIC